MRRTLSTRVFLGKTPVIPEKLNFQNGFNGGGIGGQKGSEANAKPLENELSTMSQDSTNGFGQKNIFNTQTFGFERHLSSSEWQPNPRQCKKLFSNHNLSTLNQ